MPDYGFTIKLDNMTSAELKQIENSIKSTSSTVKTETANMQDSFGKLGEAAQTMSRYMVEAFSVYEIFNFGKELLKVATEFQSFTNVIKYSSNGVVDNAQNINYLNDAITRLHLPMEQAYQQFSEMQAGMVGTGIEGNKLRKVFEGVAEASAVMHLDADKFSRTGYALKEIGELGTVQMRQMRMLAMALPGAMSIAARAMGMDSEQFHKAMKGGQINSSDFLPKFASALEERFSAGLVNAGKSLMAQINDEKNAVIKLMLDMGNSLEPLFLDILHTVKSTMEGIKSTWDSLTGNSDFVDALKFIFDWAKKIVPIWIEWKIAVFAWNTGMAIAKGLQELFAAKTALSTIAIAANTTALATNRIVVSGFAGTVETAAVATSGLASGMTKIVTAAAGWGTAGLFAVFAYIANGLYELNKEVDSSVDKITHMSELSRKMQSDNKLFGDLQIAYKGYQDAEDIANKETDKKKKKADQEYAKELLQSIVNDASTEKARLSLEKGKYYKPMLDSNKKLADSVYNAPIKMDTTFSTYFGKKHIEEISVDTRNMLGRPDYKAGLDTAKQAFNGLIGHLSLADKILASGAKNKIKATNSPTTPGSPGQDNANNTSNLAGASGGLGTAKVLNIRIDNMLTIQKVTGIDDVQKLADVVIRELTEGINGFSDSVNSQ